MVGGFKGMQYAVSPKYRARVRAYWGVHPNSRAPGIRRMILGAILDVGFISLIVVALSRA
jgi:hypothetical protein